MPVIESGVGSTGLTASPLVRDLQPDTAYGYHFIIGNAPCGMIFPNALHITLLG